MAFEARLPDVNEAFIDATFAPAKKGEIVLAQRRREKAKIDGYC